MMDHNNSETALPLVSIIMNCYNGEKYLRQSVDSVMSQTYPNWELIFWDNQSVDSSSLIIHSYNDERIKYFFASEHTSLGEARNQAMGNARGAYISFLDCDDIWDSTKLKIQVDFFLKRLDIAFVYSNFFRFGEHILGNKAALSISEPTGQVFHTFLKRYPVNLQTVMFRKEVIDNSSIKFDNQLEMSEEFDYFMQIFLNNKVGYINSPLASYRLHSNMLSIKNIDKYPIEVEYIANKLKNIDHSYSNNKDAYQYLYAKVAFYKLRSSKFDNERGVLRGILFRACKLDINFFVVWVLSFFPKKWFSYILRMKGAYS